jgi:membrane-bound ClpP family serine protease
METLLLWGFGLLGLAVLLGVIEILVPSGGIIAVLSGVAVIASLIFFFRYDTTWGLMATLAVLVLAPVAVGFAIKVYPSTPIGRRMILGGGDLQEQIVEHEQQRKQLEQERTALIGQQGRTLADMRPVGSVRVGDRKIEAVAEDGFIARGSTVRVTGVDGASIRVRRVDQG